MHLNPARVLIIAVGGTVLGWPTWRIAQATLAAGGTPDHWFWDGRFWNMPGGMGALLGSFIGFSALAAATWWGYGNVIRAQKHRADLDRREHARQVDAVVTATLTELLYLKDLVTFMAIQLDPRDFETPRIIVGNYLPRPVLLEQIVNNIPFMPSSCAEGIISVIHSIDNYNHKTNQLCENNTKLSDAEVTVLAGQLSVCSEAIKKA